MVSFGRDDEYSISVSIHHNHERMHTKIIVYVYI